MATTRRRRTSTLGLALVPSGAIGRTVLVSAIRATDSDSASATRSTAAASIGGGYSYGATGYGYALGRGWSYNHNPIILGPHGGYTVGNNAGIGLGGSRIGYRNRGSFVTMRGNTSPLYGVSRFNTQRGAPTRGGSDVQVRYGRRTVATGDQTGFRTRVGGNTRPSDAGGMRPATRAEGAPARWTVGAARGVATDAGRAVGAAAR